MPFQRLIPVRLAIIIACSAMACRETTGPNASLRAAWRTTLPVEPQQLWIGRPAADVEHVFVEAGNQLFGIDAISGRILWQYRVRIAATPAPTVPIIDGHRVYLAEVDSTFALDADLGTRLWAFHPDSQGVVVPAVDSRNVYIGQRGIPTIYAVDKVTGALRWRQNLGADYVHAASVMGIATRGDTVYATVWRFKSANGFLSSGVLVALNAVDGSEYWRYETPGDRGSFVREPLLLPGAILVNDYAGTQVTLVDSRTGVARWRSSKITALLTVEGTTIFGAGNDGNAYALAASDGVLRWSTSLGSAPSGLTLCGGSTWVANGNLHRVAPTTGVETGRLGSSGAETFISDLGTNGRRVFVAGGALVTAVECL
jgi:outer membrane protein assembly factor BamB